MRLLTETSWAHGLVGVAEVEERWAVLRWLLDEHEPDPREHSEDARDEPGEDEIADGREPPEPPSEHNSTSEEDSVPKSAGVAGHKKKPSKPGSLQLMPAGLRQPWTFTKGDPDPYPAIPHGHLGNQNRKWPKLNPYTGIGYAAMHSKDSSLTLKRRELIALWNDDAFRGFCLDHVSWWIDTHRDWNWHISKPRRFPRPR